jgi:hypothetical protein
VIPNEATTLDREHEQEHDYDAEQLQGAIDSGGDPRNVAALHSLTV